MQDILKNRTRIVVISDAHRAAKQICGHLNAEPDLAALDDVGTNIDSYTLPRESCPDLIIVQVTGRPLDGFKWIAKLRSAFSNLPIILISRGEEIVSTEKALRLGANGYVTLQTETTDILTATRCVLAGDRYTSKQYSQWLIQRTALGRSTSIRHLLGDLSKQERKVFECIGDGQSNRSIAEHIGIHAKTVATYRSRIKIKLGINDGKILAEIASECKHAESSKV